MRRLSEYRKVADGYTGKASDVTRQLILGGIAIIWLFRTTDPETQQASIQTFGVIPLITLSFAALLDICQYFVAGELWTNFFLQKERECKKAGELDPEVGAPKQYGRIIQAFYYLKISLMILSYVLIVVYLCKNLNLR